MESQVEENFVHISGRGLYGSSGLSCSNFIDKLQSGISSIDTISNKLNLPIKTASILNDTYHPHGKAFDMIQMALYEALNSAGLWKGEPWQLQSSHRLPTDFSSNIEHLPAKFGIFLGIPSSKKSYNFDGNYRNLYEHHLETLHSKIESSNNIFIDEINAICPAQFTRRLMRENSEGPNVLIQNAGVSSMQAIGEAFKAIKCGEIDLAIAGGIQEYSLWTQLNLAQFNLLSLASKVEDACRPFDQQRQGIVLGEGGGLLVLESDLSLERRREKGFGLIRSYAGSNNAYRLTSHPSAGSGLCRSIEKCWHSAGKPKLDMIIANGSGSLNSDSSECQAILNSKIGHPKVQSIKSFTGHTMAAAGAYNVIAGLLQQERKFFTHTLHLRKPDPHCDLNHILEEGIHERANTLLVNSLGLGGNTCCLILEFR